MHARFGQIMNNKIQKGQNPTAAFDWGGGQKQGTAHDPCTQHHRGGRQTTKATPPAGPTPTLTLFKEPAHSRPLFGE